MLFLRLARAHTTTKKILEELLQIFERNGGFGEVVGVLANLLGSRSDPEALYERPIVSPTAKTVTWRGRSCKLGNTMLFRLMERLNKRPNSYISYSQLINDVWRGDCRSDETIRSTVRLLKKRLKAARMGMLAKAIRSDKQHYYLDLDEIR